MRAINDVSYNGSSACMLDMYLPKKGSFETIVWFHGGGLEEGDKKQAERLYNLAFNENANIEYNVLSAGHCRGSSEPNEDGRYDYVTTMIEWLNH